MKLEFWVGFIWGITIGASIIFGVAASGGFYKATSVVGIKKIKVYQKRINYFETEIEKFKQDYKNIFKGE